jgi:hypothetical protein
MSCGRLSRASNAWRARFDAAYKGVTAIFVQPLSMTHDSEWSDHMWHIGLRGWLAVLVIAVSLVGAPLWAAEEEVNNGQDPTKPLTRLDFRYQYQNLPPG